MFDPNDRKRLKLFCEICDSIAGCRFIREFAKQSHHIFVGTLPDGRVMDEYPRYDDDDFRAFLTHYRKLRPRSNNKPSELVPLIELLESKGDPIDLTLLKHFKNEIMEEGRCWWGAVLRNAEGEKTLLTQEDLENLILNGEVFHSDVDKKERLKLVMGDITLTKAVAFLNYLRFARTVVGCSQKTAALIRQRGYLS